MDCPHCDSSTVTERPDVTLRGYRRFRCRTCRRSFKERTGSLFNRLQYPPDVISLVVLWRGYCQVVEKKAKRIACVSHCSFPLGCVLDARHLSPCRKGASSERTIMGSTRQMSTTAKQIVDRTMNREKTLGLP